MRTQSKLLFTAFVALCLYGFPNVASAEACITEFKQVEEGYGSRVSEADPSFDRADLYYAALQCKDLQAARMGLKAATYTFNIAGLGLACTQVGLPVSVGMFGVGFVLYSAELVVEALPCEDSSKEETEKMVRQQVCEALQQQGIACDPVRIIKK